MDAPESLRARPIVTTRRATAADADSIAALSGDLGYPLSVEEVRSRMGTLATLSTHAIFVAEGDGRVCGWVHVYVQHTIVVEERGEILGLVVSQEMRRRGVGRLLMAEGERWVRDRRLDMIVLRSNLQRPESHAFYPALGYEHFKSQAVYRKRLR